MSTPGPSTPLSGGVTPSPTGADAGDAELRSRLREDEASKLSALAIVRTAIERRRSGGGEEELGLDTPAASGE